MKLINLSFGSTPGKNGVTHENKTSDHKEKGAFNAPFFITSFRSADHQ